MSPWPPDDVREGAPAGAAVRLLFAAPREVWIALGLLLVFDVALHLVAVRLGVPVDKPGLSAGFFAYQVIVALASSAGVGVALHTFITGRPPFRLGAGFAAFWAFTAGLSIVSNVLATLVVSQRDGEPGQLALWSVLAVALIGVGVFVSIRLLLLPIGWLVGDRGVTPRAAWARMRGQVLSYIGAIILLSLPTTFVVLGVAAARGDPGDAPLGPLMVLLNEVLVLTYAAATAALDAVMYLRHARDPQRRLGEVFD